MPSLRFAARSVDRTAAENSPSTPAWSTAVSPFEVVGRQRLYVQQPASAHVTGDGALMLTYRVMQSGGAFHLVLFRYGC
jgi:hypothetical protein